jgi:hypothetical protein
MYSREFWLGLIERAAKSTAQCLIGLWLGDTAFDLIQVDWRHALGLAAGAAVLSVLTSIVSAPVGVRGSPSLVDDTPARHRREETP